MLSGVGGFQVFQFSQFWLVHQLSGSPLFLGYVGVANAIPAICLNLVGGVVADRVEQRRLITITQTLTASLVFLLATLTLFGVVAVWHVLAVAVAAGAVNAFNQPARQAIYPHLVDRKVLSSAVALNSSVWQGMRIVAPALGGSLIAVVNTAAAFYVAGGTILLFGFVAAGLRVPRVERAKSARPLNDLLDGLRFIKANSIFSFLIGMTFFNSFFGLAYVTLMPVFAVDVLGVGADGQGVLMSVGGIGSLAITLYLGTRSQFQHRRSVLIGGAVMTGLTLVAFALTSEYLAWFPLAIALMLVLGSFTSMYMIAIMSALQMLVPDRMRGRVMGFYGMTWNIMPLGGMFAGAVAAAIGAPWAVAIGGMLVAGFAIGPALLNRRVRNLGALLREAEAGGSVPA